MSSLFEVFSSVALAEIFAVKEDGNANLQNAVINAAVIEVGSFLHDRQGNVCRNNQRLSCQRSAVDHMTADANNLRPSYMQAMERLCKVTDEQVADLTDVLAGIYPMGLIVYYEEYIKLLQAKVKT